MQYSIIGGDGRQYGPVTLSELYQWAIEGRILATSTVIDHTSGAHLLAKDIPSLSSIFPQSSHQPASPPGGYSFTPPQYPGSNPHYPGSNPQSYGRFPQYPGGYPQYPGGNPQYPIAGSPYRPDGKPYKNRYVAGLLGIFLGSLGIHRFYLGYNGIGLLMLLITLFTFGYGGMVMGIWGIIDGIMCLTGSLNDADGYPLVG